MTKNALLWLLFGVGVFLALRSKQAQAGIAPMSFPAGPGEAGAMRYMPSQLSFSQGGLELLESFEGFSATPYPDAGGYSIGYGHYLGPYPDRTLVWTPEEGAAQLERDVQAATSSIRQNVTVPLTQNEFDALTSLVYNIGVGHFVDSTLLKKLNAGDYAGAAAEFAVWNKSQGAVNRVLVARREQESSLFVA